MVSAQTKSCFTVSRSLGRKVVRDCNLALKRKNKVEVTSKKKKLEV